MKYVKLAWILSKLFIATIGDDFFGWLENLLYGEDEGESKLGWQTVADIWFWFHQVQGYAMRDLDSFRF